MTPTAGIRTRLRKLINEVIPESGTEGDTKFSDAELDVILEEAVDIWSASSTGWLMKAALLTKDIESYSVGNESYNLTKLRDELEHATTMQKKYAAMGGSQSSYVLTVKRPDILGTES